MNKKLSLLLAALACIFILNTSAKAQVSLGAGLAYGGDIEELGLEGRFYYDFPSSSKLRLAANFTYFLVDDPLTFWTFDANIHYAFATFSGGRFYGLAGLDLANAGVDGFDSQTELGLNLGAGVEGDLSFGAVFGEVKFVLGDADQVVLGGGLRFALK